MIFGSELRLVDLTRKKVVFEYVFDPSRIDIDELVYALTLLKMIRKAQIDKEVEKSLEKLGYDAKSAWNEYRKIMSKGNVKGNAVVDPSLGATALMLFRRHGTANIGIWFCDYGSRGKYFTSELCTEPLLTEYDRRAMAINPWGLANISDLDTIMDSFNRHKSGTLGEPNSCSVSVSGRKASITGIFTAKTNASIKSVILLTCSNNVPDSAVDCYDYMPAPPGTCHSSYYTSIYIPFWGFDTDIPIESDVQYGLSAVLYPTI